MIVLLLACAGVDVPPEGGVAPILSGAGFWDSPFPADSRLVDGHPDLSAFPGATTVPIFAGYIALAPQLDGWGTNSPIYVRFAETPDASAFPTPEASVEDDSPILLLDVDPASPHRGELVPVVGELWEKGDKYADDNLLAVAPLPGFPLRPHTRYALVLRPPYAAVGEMPEGWENDPYWLDLVTTLADREIPPSHVAAATIFTTQDPTAELAKVAWQIQHGPLGRPVWEPDLTVVAEESWYTTYEGHVTVPIWQRGDRPYRDSGGGFAFDAYGRPVVQGWERVKFGLTVPTGEVPEGGWPLVLYSHGTGGDHLTFVADEGAAMAVRGVAMFGIAQPLHDDRATSDTSVELDTFNFTNPEAGRTSFRQGAADQIWLASRLKEAATTFRAGDVDVPIAHDQLAFFGHSQGAMVGALGASWLSVDCNAVGLSEAGGGTAASALLKTDPIAVEPILAAALGVQAGTLTTMHPVLGLVQMLSEATDPLNYAPTWFAEQPDWSAPPANILMTEGLLDTYTPPVTIEALATAARTPIVGEPAAEPPGFALRGLGAEALPAADNVTAWNGESVTAGLGQFADQGHFAIYYDKDASRLYLNFLESAVAGAPELDE